MIDLDSRITLLGFCSALFKAAVVLFTIQWTPALQSARNHLITDSATLPLGIIFACFMVKFVIFIRTKK